MSLRVIAGTHKRRALKTPAGLGTRPTAGRVREALFSILGNLEGLCVLDLYAGSGALGIEALSRGASFAVFVESDRAALACIRENLAELGLESRALVLSNRVERLPVARLIEGGGTVDLVFCDPPWADVDQAAASIPHLLSAMSESAQVALEHPQGRALELEGFVRDQQRRWGDTGVSFFSRIRT
jgi:16S rRNA (guanine966-N2)-methyltransferase